MSSPAMEDLQLQLEQVLLASLDPSRVRQASEQLRTLLQQEQKEQQRLAYLLLAKQIVDGRHEEVRQLAAVLLRRKIAKAMTVFDDNQQKEFITSLVARFSQESCAPVRRAVVHLLASILRLATLQEAKRQELFSALSHMAMQTLAPGADPQQLQQQVAAVDTFVAVAEACPDEMIDYFDKFLAVFRHAFTCTAAGNALGTSALKGLRSLAEFAEEPEQQKQLCALAPSVMQIIAAAVDANEDDVAATGIELIDDLLSNDNLAMKDAELLTVLDFLLKTVASRRDVDAGLRQQALSCIQWAAKQKPRVLSKSPTAIPSILDVLVSMGAEPDVPGGGPEDFEEDDLTPHRIAAQCVDALAISLPSKYIFQPMLDRLTPFTQSPEVLKKRAALVLLGIMSEGCEGVMRRKMKFFLPFVLESLRDPQPVVAASAAICFGQFAEYLQPEIMLFQREALELLLLLLDNPSALVQQKACYALGVLFENMEAQDLQPVASEVVQRLVRTLHQTSCDKVREVCLSAIGSAAAASGNSEDSSAVSASRARPFDAFAPELFPLIAQIIKMPTEDPSAKNKENASGQPTCSPATKARAIGVVGGLVQGTSEAAYAQELPGLMRLIMEQMAIETGDEESAVFAHDIRDEAFSCFSDVCAAMKDKFVVFLEEVMAAVFASLFSDEGLMADDDKKSGGTAAQLLEELDDEDDDASDERLHNIRIRDGFLDELESAALCLKTLWEHCGPHCMKFIAKTKEAIDLLQGHFHEAARQQCCYLIKAVATAAHATFAGLPVSKESPKGPLNPNVQTLWSKQLWPALHKLMEEDEEKETVGDACIALGTLAEEVGPGIFFSREMHDEVAKQLLLLLKKKHPCQVIQDIDEDDDSRQEEEYLFDGISVLICGMAYAACVGTRQAQQDPVASGSLVTVCNRQAFAATYQKIHPHLLDLATHRQSSAYAASGLGCLAEVFLAMQEDAVGYAADAKFLQAVLKGVQQDENEDYRRNACFCLGVVYEVAHAQPAVNAKTPEFLAALHSIFRSREDMNKSEQLTLDNAAAAVARMILNPPATPLPLEHLVPALLVSMPLQEDHEESEVMLKAALKLADDAATQPLIVQHIQKFLVGVILETAHPVSVKRVKPETQEKVIAMLRQLLTNPSLPPSTLQGVKEAVASKPFALEFINTKI
ncbi:HEAT repeat-containing protein [Besnoitia besnoiti]|uniref:HEAT repeat-containing protein n=1 Tax=Besnoitia besnoiti TaxID=94643 RepID=A0A2A9MQY5_BESBE|nr:HEAT repeat-containing protein [Besnoitia besnoiti]PFH38640.1 HEAT repeat-containing protein [Besnoitia besnoiti]